MAKDRGRSKATMDERRRIHICGSGGVGFWLAVALARSNYEVTVYDDDDLSGGLGAQRLPIATPSTRKVDLLRGFLRVNFAVTDMKFVAERFTGSEVAEGDLVVDCSDSATKDRKAIWRRARRQGARCLRVSYDGANSVVVVAEGMPLVRDERSAGYDSVPTLALSLAAGGLGGEAVIRAMESGLEVGYIEFQVSVGDFVKVEEKEQADAA
jgi:hypothetical protein